MNAIELLAWIFVIGVLFKLVAVLFKPADWLKAAEAMVQNRALSALVYAILAVIVGYFVLTNLSAAQIGVVMLFTGLLTGVAMMPYWKNLLEVTKESMATRGQLLAKNWPAMLIWAAVAIYLIYGLLGSSS